MTVIQSAWRDEDAEAFRGQFAEQGADLADRVYTSRLLGSDPGLVLHGGGNTSVKTQQCDELGRPVDVLCVKGSGWDLGGIAPAGLPAVALKPLLELRECPSLSDEAMVNAVRRCLMDASAPNPSVETLLHAFLPHKFIDHTHANWVLALANQPDAEAVCRRVYGDTMGIVPYIMPGFDLAQKAAEVYEADPSVEGLILINHGIFTFGDTAQIAYERMIDKVALAQRELRKNPAIRVAPPAPSVLGAVVSETQRRVLNHLRSALVTAAHSRGAQILVVRRNQEILDFLERDDLDDLARRGPITPDHVIRTKQKPLILRPPAAPDQVRGYLEKAVADYVAEYVTYFETQQKNKGTDKKRLNPLPIVFLIPGLGLVTAAPTRSAAAVAADLWQQTLVVQRAAEPYGRYQPLNDAHMFDMEYWSLEQAKLGKKKPAPMAGRVVLVTGAAGGIGRACAEIFAAEGANLVLADVDGERLSETRRALAKNHKVGMTTLAGDITDAAYVQRLCDHAVTLFGGLDCVISNAGRAFTGPIAETTDALKASLDINLLSHQYLAAAASKVMQAQGHGGCILFNASKSAFNPGPGFGAYSVAKAALIALAKQYAVELAGDQIRVMAVNADRIRTGLFDEKLVAERAAKRGLEPAAYFRANMLSVEVTAADVARAFLHLYQSAKSTATLFTVDGGNIAASPR
ncbi:bifunctional aldolase/short-chain dehydrogenase [Acanthopleuribacter pedis]|uniref:Bifunctional aldolase/short-chain dehydrogenase n=1 Tax=Acanthopleuribacter pedis TaxID=442870 RepID=A0A8J7U3B0_9BACT|nr:bifunctional aldolase/short-chain dehydrogenase [Acanthopleuribacter pedis]MBO1318148.1 bifunctional aldolase/short-chain dehydrogenase [Acanthopleuribacter pedis]